MKSWVVKNHQCSFSRIKIYEMGYFNLEQCSFLARNCQWIYGYLRIKNPLHFFFFFEKEEPIRFDVLIRREKIWETWQAKFLIPTFFFFLLLLTLKIAITLVIWISCQILPKGWFKSKNHERWALGRLLFCKSLFWAIFLGFWKTLNQ